MITKMGYLEGLLSCPFCGEKEVKYQVIRYSPYPYPYSPPYEGVIWCKCGARMNTVLLYNAEEKAIEAVKDNWNRRCKNG